MIDILSEAGCPNLTNALSFTNCSEWCIEKGGQADIYEGILNSQGEPKRVAIKIPRGDQSLRESIDSLEGNKLLKRAARELYTWSTLKHPNVAQFLGMAVFRGSIAIVSPWVKMGNFYRYIKAFPKTDRMGLCIQVANGLAYLHKEQVVLGDLKAQNVLVDADGIARITDFGSSILEESRVLFSTSESSVVSVRSMAPELFDETAKRSYQADLYALGMTFIEILTDKVPFPQLAKEAQVIKAVLDNVIPEQPKRLKIRCTRHKQWWKLLKLCWSRDPNERPSAQEWSELDGNITAGRVQELSDQLTYALRFGYTTDGLLKNLDTNEDIYFADDNDTFHVYQSTESSSADVQKLIDFYTPLVQVNQPTRYNTHAQAVQKLIYNGIEKRTERNCKVMRPNEVNDRFWLLDDHSWRVMDASFEALFTGSDHDMHVLCSDVAPLLMSLIGLPIYHDNPNLFMSSRPAIFVGSTSIKSSIKTLTRALSHYSANLFRLSRVEWFGGTENADREYLVVHLKRIDGLSTRDFWLRLERIKRIKNSHHTWENISFAARRREHLFGPQTEKSATLPSDENYGSPVFASYETISLEYLLEVLDVVHEETTGYQVEPKGWVFTTLIIELLELKRPGVWLKTKYNQIGKLVLSRLQRDPSATQQYLAAIKHSKEALGV
ncbi:Serine/threonine-protein kinase [Ceratobasidium sp. AG-Ba]|nr:Serine/threonine-protein kinase [Ceratobasidium sp. AG-Ba]